MSLSMAISAFMAGDNAMCLSTLKKLTATQQLQPAALSLQAVAMARLGRHVDAISSFRRLLLMEPQEIAHPINLALSLRAINDNDGAMEAITMALAIDRSNAQAGVLRAQLHADRGEHRVALQLLSELPDAMKSEEFLLLAGHLQFELGDERAATNLLNDALDYGLGDADAINSAGVLANLLGQLTLAEQLFRKAITSQPSHAAAVANLVCQYERTNQLSAAESLLDQFADLHCPELDLARARIFARQKKTAGCHRPLPAIVSGIQFRAAISAQRQL